MERDWNDFKAIHTNLPGARDAFEKACETLFRSIHKERNVKQVSVKRGDGGIDVYVGELGVEPVIIYQCKFFLDELDVSQHQQIQKSFKTSIESPNYKIEKWVLCLPIILNINESLWWSDWKKKQNEQYHLNDDVICLKNGNELIDLMKENGIYDLIFNIEELNLAKDTNKKITKLVKLFEPNRGTLPKIIWSTYIGKQKWKNTPLIVGENIFVGSAGDHWNKPDNNDGVYCLDANTGNIKWFYLTGSDVNEISIFDGNIVGGCDNGLVFCISAISGNEKWTKKLSSGIVSKIFKNVGFSHETLIVISYDGDVSFLNILNGEIMQAIPLKENVIGNANLIINGYKKALYIPTLSGKLIELKEKYSIYNTSKVFEIRYPDKFSKNDGFSHPSLSSPPLIKDNKIYIGFVRQTYYDYPPIVCINIDNEKVEWFASDPKKIGTHYGNIRTNLIAFKDEILFVHPYSNEIGGIDQSNGNIVWLTSLGRPMFQQWSSPIIYNNNIYIARYDGYIYKVNGLSKEREWGMYLGENDDAGVVFDKDQPISNENENAAWNLYKGFSLLSTPVISFGNLIIGSDEGYLYCINNI